MPELQLSQQCLWLTRTSSFADQQLAGIQSEATISIATGLLTFTNTHTNWKHVDNRGDSQSSRPQSSNKAWIKGNWTLRNSDISPPSRGKMYSSFSNKVQLQHFLDMNRQDAWKQSGEEMKSLMKQMKRHTFKDIWGYEKRKSSE